MMTGFLVQVLRKMFLKLRSLNANMSMFALCGYDLNFEMKEQAPGHYFGTVLA